MTNLVYAGLAQQVAQGIRNAQSAGSSPAASSTAFGESADAARGVCGEAVGSDEPRDAGDDAPEADGQAADDGALSSVSAKQGEEEKPRCRVCGRVLRSPESIARGMGRDCWRKSRRGK